MNRMICRENILLALFFLLFSQTASTQLDCDNDTTGLKALIDLQFGTYLGFQGGLYPGGYNTMPFAHLAGGMNASRKVLPRNDAGGVDWENGKVGFIGMGASTAGNCFNHFREFTDADTTINHCLKIANCAVGAKGLDIMIDTAENGWYWDDEIFPRVDNANLTPQQVQVIWLMSTSRTDTVLYWPYQPRQIADKFEVLMGILLDKFPNLQMVFVTGFAYGGYSDPTKEFYELVAEPSSYWNNWAVKWLVERQINGDPDLDYTGPDRNSPWIAWGPHFWADGLRANFVDGHFWNCYTDFQPDGGGYHLSSAGKDKEAELMMNFFKNTILCDNWFKHNTRWNSCDSAFRYQQNEREFFDMNIFPNPSAGRVTIEILNAPFQNTEITVTNSIGNIVFRKESALSMEYAVDEVDLTDLPFGLYHILLQSGDEIITKTIVLQ